MSAAIPTSPLQVAPGRVPSAYSLEYTLLGGWANNPFLLSRAARAAKALGYRRIQTYTLADEAVKSGGASLWAAGWLFSHVSKGGTWNTRLRKRRDKHPVGEKFCWIRDLQ